MKRTVGKVGAIGYALGTACLYRKDKRIKCKLSDDKDFELEKLEAGIEGVRNILSETAKRADSLTADIINAQLSILADETYIGRIREKIVADSVVAEYAVSSVSRAVIDEFKGFDNEFIKERSADIAGITRRLIDCLTGNREEAVSICGKIIIGEELTPDFVALAAKAGAKGFVSRRGSCVSHAAILCGNYDIPYLYGINVDGISEGMELAIDGEKGILYISPSDEVRDEIRSIIKQPHRGETLAFDSNIKLMANISSPLEVESLADSGADGIGLFRTEFLFMGENLPGEDEQLEAYRYVAKAMGDKEVIIRTIDIGADKKSPCIKQAKEDNPALGNRGIRLCLEKADIFRVQLRAIMRSAVYGNVSIMYPMITSVKEIEEIKKQITIASRELTERGVEFKVPRQGIIVETPAAAIMSDVLSEYVDFFSIGTNDLAQYTLAVDRTIEELEEYYNPYSEAVMRLIELTVLNAHKKGISVSICGELGGDSRAIPRFAKMGVDALSMSPNRLNNARKCILQTM